MIRTRTPFRITLGGGGTDLPSYYEKFGGMCIASAVTLWMEVMLKPAWDPTDIIAHYSEAERVQSLDKLKNDRLRECLRYTGIQRRIEIGSFATIGPKTGLGSSSTFVVGVLKSLFEIQGKHIDKEDLARAACDIELGVLKKPMGKQDQYAAAFGGMNCFTFEPDGDVKVEHLSMPRGKRDELSHRLLLFFTGISRESESVLTDQEEKTRQLNEDMIANLHKVKELGEQSKTALHKGDLEEFARIMNTHWENKKKRTQGMSNDQINRWYDLAMKNGALGGKLVGAGGGGFLMFLADDVDKLKCAMNEQGLEEIRFGFDPDGSRVVENDGNHKISVVGVKDGSYTKELQWP